MRSLIARPNSSLLALLHSISDIAAFLDANEAHTFDESFRPVPLTTHVVGQGYIGDASNGKFSNRLHKHEQKGTTS